MRIFFQGRCVLGCPCTMASLSSFSRLCMSTIQRVNTSHEATFELSEATCHVKCVFYPVRWSRLKLIPVERCILASLIPFALCKCPTVRYGGSLLEVTHCCVWRPGLWMQTGGHPAPVTRDSAHHSEWDNPKKISRRRKKKEEIIHVAVLIFITCWFQLQHQDSSNLQLDRKIKHYSILSKALIA